MGNVFGTSDVQAKVSELVIELHFWAKIAMNFHLAVDFRIVCPIVRQTSFFCVTTLRKHVLARATSSSSRVLSHEAWRGSFKIPCSSVRSIEVDLPTNISGFAVTFRHAHIYIRVSSRTADAASVASFYRLARNNTEQFRTRTSFPAAYGVVSVLRKIMTFFA